MNKNLFAKLFALVLAMCVVLSLAVLVSAANDDVLVATFDLGANGSASHYDGSEKTSYTETDGDYTLSISGGSKMYTGARDAKGNSCIKFGTGSAAGKMTISVPNDVTSVVLYVAKYKSNTAKITVNGTNYTLTKNSNDGAYDAITVDTTSTKTITFTTVSGGYRAMLNTIEFYAAPSTDCEHTNTTTTTVNATCTVDGSVSVVCDDCDFTVSFETLTAPGHSGGTATCEDLAVCGVCGTEYGKLLDHNFEDGACTECGMEEPSELTISFANTDQRVSLDTNAQVWQNGNFTFTNTKGGSTSNVADYSNPVRLYKSSVITLDCTYNLTKIVFNANTAEYANNLKSSIGAAATVSDKVVTVILDGSSNTFTATLSANQVRLDSVTVCYATDDSSAESCNHEGTEKTTNTVAATCHKDGSITETCACGAVTSQETIPAGHKMTNGECSVCGVVEAPKAGVPYKFGMYQGKAGSTNYLIGGMSGYYMATGTNAVASLNVYLEETEGGYYLYSFIDGVKFYINMVINDTHVNGAYEATASTVYTYNTEIGTLTASVNNGTYAFGTRSDNTYTTVGPVSTANGNFYCQFYAAGEVDRINSASVTLGTDLGMNFTVTVPMGEPTMTVEFAGKTYVLTAEQLTETTYKFSFKGIGPHQMAEIIKATLYVDDEAMAEVNNYSVEKNLKAILANDASLAGIVNAVLAYGEAAENYVGVEGGVVAPETDEETVIADAENKLDVDNAADFGFTAAGVNFDSANKIYVKFYVEGEFKFYVNGVEVELEKTENGSYKFYTTALTAKQFNDEFTFEIEVNGVKATLVYSVNTYAYAMQDDADMGELVKALYVYGCKAEAYA